MREDLEQRLHPSAPCLEESQCHDQARQRSSERVASAARPAGGQRGEGGCAGFSIIVDAVAYPPQRSDPETLGSFPAEIFRDEFPPGGAFA